MNERLLNKFLNADDIRDRAAALQNEKFNTKFSKIFDLVDAIYTARDFLDYTSLDYTSLLDTIHKPDFLTTNSSKILSCPICRSKKSFERLFNVISYDISKRLLMCESALRPGKSKKFNYCGYNKIISIEDFNLMLEYFSHKQHINTETVAYDQSFKTIHSKINCASISRSNFRNRLETMNIDIIQFKTLFPEVAEFIGDKYKNGESIWKRPKY